MCSLGTHRPLGGDKGKRETFKVKALVAITFGAIALTGCAYANRVEMSTPPTTVPAVVTIVNGETGLVDVSPPQRLDVRYVGSDGIEQATFQADCDWSGGSLVWSDSFVASGEFVCQGVDY